MNRGVGGLLLLFMGENLSPSPLTLTFHGILLNEDGEDNIPCTPGMVQRFHQLTISPTNSVFRLPVKSQLLAGGNEGGEKVCIFGLDREPGTDLYIFYTKLYIVNPG